jgi:molybdopterin-guanine dinucleotide biosynthesis protein A
MPSVAAVILAGGASSRFGGRDKGLLMLRAEPLVAHVLRALLPQVDTLCIIANRNVADYQCFGHPVYQDADWPTQQHQGPMAGFRSAFAAIPKGQILVVPVDAIALPPNLYTRLTAAGAPAAAAATPVCALLADAQRSAFDAAWSAGLRSPKQWLAQIGANSVGFDDPTLVWSVNTPEELAALERHGEGQT